mgnify:FL=1|tara:strand:+ start:82 stop:390 length:309 start_codon:yes stop_codon:yes gene_type:complete
MANFLINRIRGAGKTITEIREEPGKSNAGKYPNVSSNDFAGPDGTYPINTLSRAKSALKLAHNASNPSKIRSAVYEKYPELKDLANHPEVIAHNKHAEKTNN